MLVALHDPVAAVAEVERLARTGFPRRVHPSEPGPRPESRPSGVLERHPRLRVAFLEAGCGWLPYWLWRMDEHWEKTQGIAGEPALAMKPSDYFRRQCWISCEPDEPYLPAILDFIGDDRVLFTSDYPHPDHKWPETAETMLAMPIPDGSKSKILWNTPAAFYGLACA
jgi:predicted TIM-barrel fold metal-dependent hydrolase